MKIVVFGGSGFIGSHVVEQMLLAGEQPVCPVRRSANSAFLESINADCLISDFDDASLLKLLHGVDVVVNCIARPELHLSLAEHRKVDVELTARLLRLAIAAGVKRFLQLSTVQVYGFGRPAVAVNEDYPVSADYHFNQVAIEREQVLHDIADKADIELVILRPCNTVGARDPNFLQIVASHRKGFFPVFGKEVRFSCIDTRDVGRAMVWLARKDHVEHHCYLLTGFDISWNQVKEKLDALTGKTSRLLYLPESMMMVVGYICEKLYPYGTHPPLTRFAVKVMSTNTLFDSSRIRQEGFHAHYSFDNMLEDYCNGL